MSILIKHKSIKFIDRGAKSGTAEVGRTINEDVSSTMSAGIANFDSCSVEWTVLYDEIIYVISGHFRLVLKDKILDGFPGDTIFIKKGTWLKYEGKNASIFYAVYPGNWKSINNIP